MTKKTKEDSITVTMEEQQKDGSTNPKLVKRKAVRMVATKLADVVHGSKWWVVKNGVAREAIILRLDREGHQQTLLAAALFSGSGKLTFLAVHAEGLHATPEAAALSRVSGYAVWRVAGLEDRYGSSDAGEPRVEEVTFFPFEAGTSLPRRGYGAGLIRLPDGTMESVYRNDRLHPTKKSALMELGQRLPKVMERLSESLARDAQELEESKRRMEAFQKLAKDCRAARIAVGTKKKSKVPRRTPR